MDNPQVLLWQLKGMLAEMSPEDRKPFDEALSEIRVLVEKHGEAGTFAIVMLNLEQTVKDDQ